MSSKTNQLQKLIQLAQEQSSDGRRELLREITDLFTASQSEISETESLHFAEIVGHLISEVETDVRQHLAERLSTVDNAPHGIVTMLANDEIDVARPLLESSPVLRNADLIDIIRKRSQDHLSSVAGRDEVDESVSDALVDRGDDQVLEKLARNQGAALSRSAASKMVARSEKNPGLQEPLVTRADLPPDLVNQMYFWVSEKLREHIMAATGDLDEVGGNPDTTENASPAEKFIRRKILLKQLDPPLLVELMREGRMAEFVEGFARLTGLDNKTAQKVLSDETQQALAIACKASGIDKDHFSSLARLTSSNGTMEAADIFEIIELYEKIPEEAAQRTMRFWRVRQAAGEGVDA